MARETFNYGKLIAGETNYIVKVPVSAGTYKVGDVLECPVTYTGTVADSTATIAIAFTGKYAKAAAEVKVENQYVVCYEDVTAEDNQEIVCIKEGYFNENVIKVNNKEVTATGKAILLTKNIFVTKVQE